MDCSFPKTLIKTKELSLLRVCKKRRIRVTEKKENKSILDYIYIKIMLNGDCLECSNEIQTKLTK